MYSYRPNASDGNRYDVQAPLSSSGDLSDPAMTYGGAASGEMRLHHLQSLPQSIRRFAAHSFSQERIERALHSKMVQVTNRDSDRFRQLLRWIKSRQSAIGADAVGELEVDGATISVIRRQQFQNVLEVLGVFATQAQADNLFDKYDTKGRGYLTLHELMCRASSALESDHSQNESGSSLVSGSNTGSRADDMFVNKGKRQFLRQKLTGEGERPITPRQAASLITVPIIVRALREKLRVNSRVGDTGSVPRSRRELARVFEYYDPLALGSITQDQVVRALHSVNFPLGEQHQRLLMDSFPASSAPALMATNGGAGMAASSYAIQKDRQGRAVQDPHAAGFDYFAFILFVYPDSAATPLTNPSSTSLYLNHQLGREFFDNLSVEERRKRGLPPTHEQFEAMQAAAAAAATAAGRSQSDEYGAGGAEEKEQQQHSLSGSVTPRVPAPQSQFARERAPPTPMQPLSPSQHYLNISGRAPPANWAQSLQRNPYLQTVLANGAQQPGFPFAKAAQAMAQPHQQHLAPPSGSASARSYGDSSLAYPPPSPRTPNGGRIGQQQQQQYGGTSNALNPFSATASFIPNAAFARPSTTRGMAGAGASGSDAAFANGADAFANILAAPSPTRRPQTGISTYTRGGGGRPLPPVTARSRG